MPQIIKNALTKLGLFNFARYSKLGDLYDHFFNPDKKRQENNELSFYKSFLPQCRLIFDIGANDGHKTIVFSKMGAKVIACDPDPYNLAILKTRFRNKKNIIIEPLAITDHIGECDFYIQQPGSALNSINPQWRTILEEQNNNRWNEPIKFSGVVLKTKTTTLDALIAKYGVPDFIKIDVEGNEKNVLKGLSHRVNHISFEVLLPEFLNDALDCMDLVSANSPITFFNYTVEEKLVLPEFLNQNDFENLLLHLSIPHLEIIAAAG